VCDGRIYGYAGGLGPENVAAQLPIIDAHRSGPGLPLIPYWIDMETKIRDEQERLDLSKVRTVLEICRRHIDGQAAVPNG
jgi:hypothetical protein